MKKQFQVLMTILFVLSILQTSYAKDFTESVKLDNNLSSVEISKSLTSMPMTFTKNMGQWDSEVLFRADAGGATMWFSSGGAYYQFTRIISLEDENSFAGVTQSLPKSTQHESDKIETITIKANFVGANANPVVDGSGLTDYAYNYFLGNDESKWATDVPNYNYITYKEIYSGIDLKYYDNGKEMEYDFIVSPGADFSQIKIQYEGAKSIAINVHGELVVSTKWGEFVEQRPVVYQNIDAVRVPVEGKYQLVGDNSFAFELDTYDPELPLVIDPVISYSTYLGGNDVDYGYDIAVDSSGAVYVTGKTFSTNFPTLDPFQDSFHGGDAFFKGDAFVTKISNSGSLVYSTYLGGSVGDNGYGIAVNASGEAYITGIATSDDFPLHNPYDSIVQGGDVFVTKLNSSGNGLIYSTYLGGAGGEWGYAITIDASGAAYITGKTSGRFPLLNPVDDYELAGDAFVTKLNPSGSSLIYSTYLGGSDSDVANSIAIDDAGAVYVTGSTSSDNFPIQNAYLSTFQGNADAFVTKLSSTGDSIIYSTYLGGSAYDESFSIAVDASGAAYVAGVTASANYPTSNAFTSSFQGATDAFVTKLSSGGNSLVFSTYLGGRGFDIAYGIDLDTTNAVYVTGRTSSNNFPTLNAFQALQQSRTDAFVTKFNKSGDELIYSTYFGGSGVDEAFKIVVNDLGEACVTGNTNSSSFPILNPIQGTYQGSSYDGFVAKLDSLSSCCIGIRGNIDSDGLNQVDLSDLIFMIDFMFHEGATPLCLSEADINNSGGNASIDIADIVLLVEFIYANGNAPINCP